MSKITLLLIGVAMLIGLVPFALIARSRASLSPKLAIHLVLDMDKQPKFKTQSPSPVFADGRSMRPHIDGTVAREDMFVDGEMLNDPVHPRMVAGEPRHLRLDSPTEYAAVMLGRNRPPGMTDAQFDALKPVTATNPAAKDEDIAKDSFYVHSIPAEFKVTTDFIERGQERFNIYCSPCHGLVGYGDGMVNQRAQALQTAGLDPLAAGKWVQPQDLQAAKIRTRPDGNIFNTITNGARTMPPYDKQISVPDRWAIVAYIRALQRSQDAQVSDLTPPELQKLAR